MKICNHGKTVLISSNSTMVLLTNQVATIMMTSILTEKDSKIRMPVILMILTSINEEFYSDIKRKRQQVKFLNLSYLVDLY